MATSIKETLTRYKVYFDRARWYIIAVQFLFICLLTLKSFGIEINFWLTIILFLIIIGLMLVVGYLDVKYFKIFELEQKNITQNNPIVMEILKKLRGE